MRHSKSKETSANFSWSLSKIIFNYRNCLAPCSVENVFGMSTVIFWPPEKQRNSPQKATGVSSATVYIHNYLKSRIFAHYTSPGTCNSDDVNTNSARFIDSNRYKGFPVKASEFNRKENKYFGSVRGSVHFQCYKCFTKYKMLNINTINLSSNIHSSFSEADLFFQVFLPIQRTD